MTHQKAGKVFLVIITLVLSCVLITGSIRQKGVLNTKQQETIDDPNYRAKFFSKQMRNEKETLSDSCLNFLKNVEKEVQYFPIPASTVDKSLKVSFVDAWMAERKYNGKSGHEGTDIMASHNERGLYPVVSMTDGEVTNIGWLEKGGYRLGISTKNGTYYYYAHLDSYANLKKGDSVKAGELLGYMGDTGYGKEGTMGKFDVHLHVGIYSYNTGQELSFNPYFVLRSLENNKLKYPYF